MDDLPVRAAGLARHARQVAAAIERLGQGIEGPQDLIGRPPPSLWGLLLRLALCRHVALSVVDS
jgi:hypothetical protein